MQMPQTFNWLQYVPPGPSSVDIKIEPSFQDSEFSLLSPSPPSVTRSEPSLSSFTISSPLRKRSNTTLASPKRVRPYPSSSPHEHRFRREGSGRMAHQSFGPWSTSGRAGNNRPLNSGERRSSDDDQLSSYTLSNVYDPHSFSSRTDRSDARTPPSGNNMTPSSLTGAIGDGSIADPRRSDSPKAEPPYGVHIQSPAIVWATSHPSSQGTYSADPSQGNIPYHTLSPATSPITAPTGPYTHYDYNASSSSSYNNPSPESIPPPSPAGFPPSFAEPFNFQQSRGQLTIHPRAVPHSHYTPPAASASPPSQPSTVLPVEEKLHEEIRLLRKKVHELELINDSARLRVRELEAEIANDLPYGQAPSTSMMGGLPSPLSSSSPQSASFQASWKTRTDARVRHFCSLNRAGNALCAWHDSRRERRAHPPRMAPPGQLNCGCTHEEALFEESLARHGVGSYHPGETVRMDPALRNPLLKLLQTRYGYKDGEFERDPITGEWTSGEGHAYWEQKAQSATNSRKPRGDIDRR